MTLSLSPSRIFPAGILRRVPYVCYRVAVTVLVPSSTLCLVFDPAMRDLGSLHTLKSLSMVSRIASTTDEPERHKFKKVELYVKSGPR